MSDNERKFRRMWNWIAEETRRQERPVGEREYFDAFGMPIRERPLFNCYACAEARQRARDDHNCGIICNYCPIDWGKCGCTEEGTLFYNWGYAHSYEDAARFAEKIARLAWKDKCERAD